MGAGEAGTADVEGVGAAFGQLLALESGSASARVIPLMLLPDIMVILPTILTPRHLQPMPR